MIRIIKKVEFYMNLLNNKKYVNDIIKVSNLKFINFEMLKNKSIALSGATGMIGSFLIDAIMYLNKEKIKLPNICFRKNRK